MHPLLGSKGVRRSTKMLDKVSVGNKCRLTIFSRGNLYGVNYDVYELCRVNIDLVVMRRRRQCASDVGVPHIWRDPMTTNQPLTVRTSPGVGPCVTAYDEHPTTERAG